MIPLKIHRPKSRFAVLTLLLIVINTGVFILTYYSKDFEKIVDALAFKLGPQSFWTWFTAMFLHANWFHLVGNMVFLYIFGSLLENVLSRFKYILLYLIGGLAAAMAQGLIILFLNSDQIDKFAAIGASGAIFALMGVVMIRFRQNKVTWYVITPLLLLELLLLSGSYMGPIGFISGAAVFMVIVTYGFFMQDLPFWQLFTVWPIFTVTALATGMSYLFMQITFGIMQVAAGEISGVAYWAHVGGLVAGIIIVRYLGISSDAYKEYLAQDAASLVRQGRFKDAAELYQKLIDKGIAEPYFLHKAAKAWALSGQAKIGLKYFKQAFSAYYQAGRKEDASQVYDDIQNFLPDECFDAKTELKFASLCQAQYKLESAIRGYLKVIENYPGTQEAELAYFRAGQAYQKMGEFEKANQTFSSFLKNYPHSQWSQLAKQWLNNSNPKTA